MGQDETRDPDLPLVYALRLDGSRVLDGNYRFNPLAIAMAKGQDGRLSYVDEVVARAKQSGKVQQVVDGFSSRAMIRVAR